MEIPFKRIVWNEHEAALLVEVYEKVHGGFVKRPDAISQLSKRLRAPMLKDGVAISDKYRNVAGMDLQLWYIERYLNNGNEEFGNTTIPKTFENVISLKNNNLSSFNNLLNEANLLYPLVRESNYDASKLVDDSSLVSEPEVLVWPKKNSFFDWNKFEATLIINLFNQVQNGSLIESEACDIVMVQFSHCSPVIDRKILPCKEDLMAALSDVKAYENRELEAINDELEKALELLDDNELAFREVLDSAMKLYPLQSTASFFWQGRKDKEEDKEKNNIEVPASAPAERQKPKILVTEMSEKTKTVSEAKERKSVYQIANESELVKNIVSPSKNGKYTIDDFYTLKNRIHHIVTVSDFFERNQRPSFFSTIEKNDGQKYVIWRVDEYNSNEEEVLQLLSEYSAYKERYSIKSSPTREAIDETKSFVNSISSSRQLRNDTTLVHSHQSQNTKNNKRVYLIPAQDNKVAFYGVKLLTLRARSSKDALDYAVSKGISKVIPIKTFVEIDGKSCHAIPLENFIPSPKDGAFLVMKNPYGVDFAVWYVDAAKHLGNDDILNLVKESICFNSLKPDTYVAPEILKTMVEPKILIKESQEKKVSKVRILPNARIKEVLVDNYRNGYRLHSNMDKKRFANFYELKYGEALSIDGDTLDNEVSKCGIVCTGDKIYVPEAMLDTSIKDELFTYINMQFETSTQCIYYNVLFNEFSDKFLGQKILDEAMLHSYLEYYDVNEDYTFESQYFSKDSNFSLDVNSKVIDFVKEQGRCVYENEVISALSFIPEAKVVEAFNGNKNILLTAGRGKRFHISNFQLEIEDKQVVIDYLSKEIRDMRFVSFLELFEKLRIVAPRIIDNNIQFSETGIRSAFSVMLNDLFYIRGGIISDKDNPISLQDAFIDFAKGRDSFSIDEVQLMADDFGTLINFEALAIHNIRVSDELYVSKDYINFSKQSIDKAIEMFLKDDIISILDISTFAAFPDCGYKWNKYLLESYVYDNSDIFCLFHNRFNKSSVSGAIVRKSSKYNSYNDVLAKALSNATIPLDKKPSVLEYLAETGFIARRQLDGIDQVIHRAQQLKK